MTELELTELQKALGHSFVDTALLQRAITHSSALGDRLVSQNAADNEQLEYLGDAVLGMLVSEYLVRAFPDWDEGRLSKSRARLVNAGSLCSAARRLGLGDFLRLGRGEEKTGGRDKPALLADAFEAMIAAIYLDGGLAAAREFVAHALLESAIVAEGGALGLSDHKSALQELLQARGLAAARYRVVREAGPDHQKTFWVEVTVPEVVSATGSGSNKKEAERAAAEQALAQLAGQSASPLRAD